MIDEFFGEFPPFAARPTPGARGGGVGFVPGNYVAEPGQYVCAACDPAIAPPPVRLRPGQRLPACARCGPEARWVKHGGAPGAFPVSWARDPQGDRP